MCVYVCKMLGIILVGDILVNILGGMILFGVVGVGRDLFGILG